MIPATPKIFDLTPHPRILPMLGEIVLAQWRCLAELVDNAGDSFLEAKRAGTPIQNPKVFINIPTGGSPTAQLSVRDNGPGMDAETLERAARAGWTSHDPINNLGLFGMGFNIATARLGHKTTIWTTRRDDHEWVGLQIDFDQLLRQRTFITQVLSRPKASGDISGTEVIVEKMRPEQRDWFARGYNRSNASRQLGLIYTTMLGSNGVPLRFQLEINGNQVRPFLHCIWGGPGNPERTVETVRYGPINAFQQFDQRLDVRPFCRQCLNWLAPGELVCSLCGDDGQVVQRDRRIHGWVGIQRYMDTQDFGIDFLRNGRKIETRNKDLFIWYDENTNTQELEYPIDDPRGNGRIVGEVHIDHGRIPYTKDRFVREDAAWQEMIETVRGKGPLRPEKRAELGFGENTSPLYRLFQAFRRSQVHNRRAGGWNRILAVQDNNRAKSMARNFEAGEVEYQTDEKWWELIEEAELNVISTPSAGGTGIDTLGGGATQTAQPTSTAQAGSGQAVTPPEAPVRHPLASLAQTYMDELTGQRYEIRAYSVDSHDSILGSPETPWSIQRTAPGPWEFFVNVEHAVFRSVTLTPLDALLLQLAWLICDFERGRGSQRSLAVILSNLRQQYSSGSRLDPAVLIGEANAQLNDIAQSLVGKLADEDSRAFYEEMSPGLQESIRVTMAARGVVNPALAIGGGRFLQYAPPRAISDFVLAHPEYFFDGRYWDDQYEALDYGSITATEEARKAILSYYGGLLADATWLAQQIASELERYSRERLMRASLATMLLASTARQANSR